MDPAAGFVAEGALDVTKASSASAQVDFAPSWIGMIAGSAAAEFTPAISRSTK